MEKYADMFAFGYVVLVFVFVVGLIIFIIVDLYIKNKKKREIEQTANFKEAVIAVLEEQKTSTPTNVNNRRVTKGVKTSRRVIGKK
jgi:uncharacterized membrane protein YqiK